MEEPKNDVENNIISSNNSKNSNPSANIQNEAMTELTTPNSGINTAQLNINYNNNSEEKEILNKDIDNEELKSEKIDNNNNQDDEIQVEIDQNQSRKKYTSINKKYPYNYSKSPSHINHQMNTKLYNMAKVGKPFLTSKHILLNKYSLKEVNECIYKDYNQIANILPYYQNYYFQNKINNYNNYKSNNYSNNNDSVFICLKYIEYTNFFFNNDITYKVQNLLFNIINGDRKILEQNKYSYLKNKLKEVYNKLIPYQIRYNYLKAFYDRNAEDNLYYLFKRDLDKINLTKHIGIKNLDYLYEIFEIVKQKMINKKDIINLYINKLYNIERNNGININNNINNSYSDRRPSYQYSSIHNDISSYKEGNNGNKHYYNSISNKKNDINSKELSQFNINDKGRDHNFKGSYPTRHNYFYKNKNFNFKGQNNRNNSYIKSELVELDEPNTINNNIETKNENNINDIEEDKYININLQNKNINKKDMNINIKEINNINNLNNKEQHLRMANQNDMNNLNNINMNTINLNNMNLNRINLNNNINNINMTNKIINHNNMNKITNSNQININNIKNNQLYDNRINMNNMNLNINNFPKINGLHNVQINNMHNTLQNNYDKNIINNNTPKKMKINLQNNKKHIKEDYIENNKDKDIHNNSDIDENKINSDINNMDFLYNSDENKNQLNNNHNLPNITYNDINNQNDDINNNEINNKYIILNDSEINHMLKNLVYTQNLMITDINKYLSQYSQISSLTNGAQLNLYKTYILTIYNQGILNNIILNQNNQHNSKNHSHFHNTKINFNKQEKLIASEYEKLKKLQYEKPEYISDNLNLFENYILLPIYNEINLHNNNPEIVKSYSSVYFKYKDAINSIITKNNLDGTIVEPYGSIVNNFLTSDGDIDISIVPNNVSKIGFKIYLEQIEKELIKRNLITDNSDSNETSRIYISTRFALLSITDIETNINIDITVHNLLPINNTKMIRLYSLYDQRFHILGIFLKHWVKINNIKGFPNKFLSSYALLLLIIHFLQSIVEPKILPILQDIKNDKDKKEYDYKYFYDDKEFETNLYYEDNFENMKEYMNIINCGRENTCNISELLVQFFEYYGYIYNSGEHYLISIKHDEKIIANNTEHIAFPLEDPFDVSHNPSSSLKLNTPQYSEFIFCMRKEINNILSGQYFK